MADFISVSSKDLTAGSDNDFVVKFTNPIEDIKRIKISKIVIPQTWYTIETGVNDKIYFTETTVWVATLDPGVYTASQLATEVAAQMNTAYTTDNNFSCTLNTTLFKFTITHSATAHTLTFGTNTTSSSASTLGYNASDTSSATSHVADNVYNLGFNETIFIGSKALAGRRTFIGDKTKKIIFPMTCNGNFGDLLTYDGGDSDWIIEYFPKRSFDEIDLQLYFEDLTTLVPLNGHEWRITFQYFKLDHSDRQ